MLSVANKLIVSSIVMLSVLMLIVIMMSVIVLNVMAPVTHFRHLAVEGSFLLHKFRLG